MCGEGKATSFSYIDTTYKMKLCRVVGLYVYITDNEEYYILIDNFFSQTSSAVDWLAHMHEKKWVNWNDFYGYDHAIPESCK